MKKLQKYILKLFLFLLIIVVITSCRQNNRKNRDSSIVKTSGVYKKILAKKRLRVVVDYNSTNYFVYKAVPMGFKYELLKALAKKMDVKLDIVVSNNLSETFDGLRNGRYDLVAKNLTVTKKRNAIIDFTEPFEQTRQVLVQRLPENWMELSSDELDKKVIRNQLDLAGKVVHVQKNTAYFRRLKNLSEEIGENIKIIEDSVYGVEKLVELVAKGDIEYTVCDENVALVNKTYFPNLDVSTPVSFSQNIAWGVKKDSGEWLDFLNEWIRDYIGSSEYRYIYNKYFLSPRSKYMVESEFHSIKGGRISVYDDIVKEASISNNWDWRFISSIIYVESKFDPNANSWVGALGLMQLMPATAEFFKVEDIYDPKQNIKGGVKLLSWLDGVLKPIVTDSTERAKFVLASFNVGLGHVKDAQRLAKKYDKNPNVWNNNVDYYLLNKSQDKYIKDPVVKWGYCRGEEPYNFVNRVLNNYQHYLNVIPE